MLVGLLSTAAFAPPPPLALYEPADRIGAVSSSPRARPSPRPASVTTAPESTPPAVTKQTGFASVVRELSARIKSLKVEAQLDGVPFSVASYADFFSFLLSTQPRSRPALFLNDNGNLRALWRNSQREQVGLQFLGGGHVQFVIFKHRPGADAMTRVTGVDSKTNIIGQIRASGAMSLLAG